MFQWLKNVWSKLVGHKSLSKTVDGHDSHDADKTSQSNVFYEDKPITSIANDKLNWGEFAKGLTRSLVKYAQEASLIVGLYGKWGSGKTSILNIVSEELNKPDNDNVKVINFNPWMCANEQQRLQEFFKQLKSCFDGDAKTKEIWDLINRYSHLIEGGVALASGGVLAPVAKVITAEAKKRSEIEECLQEVKQELIAKLNDTKQKIIVIIDDLDRLSDDEIIASFKLVKSVADFPYTIYLLAFDDDVVVKALKKVQCDNGREYLEKIVQVPMAMPIPDKQAIHTEFLKRLEAIIGRKFTQFQKDRASKYVLEHGVLKYITSIRNSIRLLNVFTFKFFALKGYVDMLDLLELTCLQVFEPEIYEQISKNKDKLCIQIPDEDINSNELLCNNKLNKLLNDDGICTHGNPAIKEILEDLFCKNTINIKNKRRNANLSDAILIKYAHERHWRAYEFVHSQVICDPLKFDRYFSLNVKAGDYSSDEIEELICNGSEEQIKEKIQEAKDNGCSDNLLREMYAFIQYLAMGGYNGFEPCKQIETITYAFIKIYPAEEKSNSLDDCKLFNSVLNLLLYLNVLESGKLLKILFCKLFADQNIPFLNLAEFFVFTFSSKKYWLKFYKHINPANEYTIFNIFYKSCIEIFFNRMLSAVESKELFAGVFSTQSIWVLYRMNEFYFNKLAKSIIKIVNSDNIALAKFVVSYIEEFGESDFKPLMQFIDLPSTFYILSNAYRTSQLWQLLDDYNLNNTCRILSELKDKFTN